jgi:Glycosyl transferases group 1
VRIWLVQTGEEMPFDGPNIRLLRTALLANELAGRGHDVTYVNACFNHQQKKQRSISTVFVPASVATGHSYRTILLAGRGYARNISLGRYFSQIENARSFERLAPSLELPDIVYAGFPPVELAHAAVSFACEREIPTVVDCRDMWPEIIVARLPKALRWLAMPLIGAMEREKRQTLSKATAITGITDHFVSWGVAAARRLPRLADRPFHLAASQEPISASEREQAQTFWDGLIGPRDAQVRMGCFIGTLAKGLDIQSLLDGLDLLSADEGARCRIVICGKGDIKTEIERRAAGNPRLIYGGWCNRAQLAELMDRSDFGVLPYPNSPDFLASYPNKVGEYLMAGLPILTGLEGATGALLEEAGLKLSYQVGNPQSFAASLRTIIARQNLPDLAASARRLGEMKFDAKRIYPAMADWLEAIANKELQVA